MARHCRSNLAWPVAFGVALACAPGVTWAQVQDTTNPSLFTPHFDGDTKRPPQFRKPGATALPTSSAGTTGFDATNNRAKKKSKETARRRAPADAENLPPIVASGPDRTVAPVFQRQESGAAIRRRALNSAAVPLDATGPIAARPVRRRFVEEDPFGPVGFYRGPFLYKPAVEISGGYDSNPGQRTNGKGSSFEKVAPELQIKSDWSRHEVAADLRGYYIWYNDDQLSNYSKPNINLRGTARIDVTKQTKADLEGRFGYAADNPGDPNLPTDVAKPPIYTTTGGTVGVSHAFNRLELSLKGSVDNTTYKDAMLNDGTPLDLSDRNYDQYTTRLRATYETLPGIKPFVEYGVDTRKHELPIDSSGFLRDSDGRTIKVGTTFELTGYLTGEISVGRVEREYEDPTFKKLHGNLLDASLVYFATPLTTLKLDAKTAVDESILAGVSGALRQDISVQIDHAFRRWLVGTVRLGYGTDNYEGSTREDERIAMSAGLIYKMTREMHLKGEYRRESLRSTFPGQDYTANIFTVGLRLQR